MVFSRDLLTFLEEKQCYVNNELLLLPKDKLTTALRGEERLYFKETMQDGKRHRELINKKTDILCDLARKEYLLKEKAYDFKRAEGQI